MKNWIGGYKGENGILICFAGEILLEKGLLDEALEFLWLFLILMAGWMKDQYFRPDIFEISCSIMILFLILLFIFGSESTTEQYHGDASMHHLWGGATRYSLRTLWTFSHLYPLCAQTDRVPHLSTSHHTSWPNLRLDVQGPCSWICRSHSVTNLGLGASQSLLLSSQLIRDDFPSEFCRQYFNTFLIRRVRFVIPPLSFL